MNYLKISKHIILTSICCTLYTVHVPAQGTSINDNMVSETLPLEVSNIGIISDDQKEKDLQELKQKSFIESTLRYGSYDQQISMITKIRDSKKDEMYEYLRIPIDNSENSAVLFAVMDAVNIRKIDRFYFFYEEILNNKADRYYLTEELISQTLYYMTETEKSETYERFYISYFTNENIDIKKQAVVGIGRSLTDGYRSKLKELYADSEDEYLKIETLRSIGAYKNPEDIIYFDNIIWDEISLPVHKWIAVVELRHYTESKDAENTLIECYRMDDIEIKSRAIYALSFFKGEKTLDILYKACNDNSSKIRMQGIKGLINYNNDKVNLILRYKAKHDNDPKIKKEAKNILKEKGLKDEE
ncbi:HEAT repeat domain-containing protein [Spirochaetota bacterium]